MLNLITLALFLSFLVLALGYAIARVIAHYIGRRDDEAQYRRDLHNAARRGHGNRYNV